MFFLKLCIVGFLSTQVATAPNFVLILTDDQDLLLRSVSYMPKTRKLVANEGITFTNFFVNSPICCPSRSSLLTGHFPHNVQVFNNSLSGGCSGTDWQQQYERFSVASILKSSKDYINFYGGKYLNEYGSKKAGGLKHIPPGYNWWFGLEGNSKYYNYTLSINGSEQFFENDYLTDKITQYAVNFLDEVKFKLESNFFMILAPPACHAPFTPAPRHRNLFPDVETVKSPPFNATPNNKHWLVGMPPKNLPKDITILDNIYKNRLRTLQAVDDMVETVINKLDETGTLGNTFVIVTSDNGFHIGQFTQPWDKRQPYESDIRVPFLVRGPKIPKKVLSDFPASTVDIVPTILDLAGIEIDNLDGKSFSQYLFKYENVLYEKFILVEYWGEGDASSIDPQCPWHFDQELAECSQENWCKCQDSRNNTYSCVIKLSNNENFKFCSFQGGFIEAYDLITDPYELHNLKLTPKAIGYYQTILHQLKNCYGINCQIKSHFS